MPVCVTPRPLPALLTPLPTLGTAQPGRQGLGGEEEGPLLQTRLHAALPGAASLTGSHSGSRSGGNGRRNSMSGGLMAQPLPTPTSCTVRTHFSHWSEDSHFPRSPCRENEIETQTGGVGGLFSSHR